MAATVLSGVFALRSGRVGRRLVSQGAPPPDPDPVSELIAAVLRADVLTVQRIQAEHPDVVAEARRSRPGLIVWAAARGPVRAVELLVELGFEVNALGRADAPVEEPWQTALHHGAGNGDVDLTRRLLELGADPSIRDQRFNATALDWARHLHQEATAELLA
jgi:hypothetical protein